jgi:hypothetical protein
MKTRVLWSAAALLLLLGSARVALAMAGEYGKGDPKHPIGNSTWPAGTELLANRADRIGGFWVNANDTFFFAGDAKAFNNFLQQYAKVEGSHYLMLRSGDNHDAFALQPLHGDHQDWELQAGSGMASVSLAFNGRIALRDLRIPRNVQIGFEGTPNKEVAAFLARHKVPEPKKQ